MAALRSMRAGLAGAVLACALAAQEQLQVEQPEPGTIRLGDTARATIRIEGAGANPREPQLPSVDGMQLRLSPPSRSSYTFYDGRELIQRVGVQYVLELRPLRAGAFVVPPFPIWTGTREQRTPELRLDAREDLVGQELGWLDVSVEPRRVYVHEPVRIRVDYGVLEGVRLVQDFHNRYRYLDIEVQAGWLNEFPGGERIDLPEPSGDTRIAVVNRMLVRTAFEGEHERQGQRWQHFTVERAFLPTRLGKIELSAPTLRFHVLRREGQQDLLGRTRGGLSENYYVYGKPVTLDVLPIPEEGRPSPYYGAVGRFSIDASLDRDQVKVGESLKLMLTVRGQGNLEFLRLPELDQLDGFHKLGQAEAKRDAEKVVVTYDLAPLSADVRRIPPIRWNYFDTTPGVERFVEVATEPLALQVAPIADGEVLAALPDAGRAAVTPGVDDVFDLPEFDGAPAVAAAPGAFVRWLAVIGPWFAVVGAFFATRLLRERRRDVRGQRARGASRACEASLRRGDDPLDALAGYVADRLDVPPAAVIAPDLADRLRAAGIAEDDALAVARAVDRGTAARYGGGVALTADEVRGLVRRLEGRRAGGAGVLLLFGPFVAALLAAGPVPAPCQGPEGVESAVSAYRAGDYATADAGFARAFEATGDRRLLRARGNCLFRLGDLPRALWAYECSLRGLPRDPELLANVRLVRERLELPERDAGFGAELVRLTRRLSAGERLPAAALAMLGSALCLVFGWRRIAVRWFGFVLLAPGAWLAADVVWLEPTRPVEAVALRELSLSSEPRGGLAAVATVRPGATVTLRGGASGDYVRVDAGSRSGYAERAAVAVVE